MCDWCLSVKEREQVLVGTPLRALPLVRAFHRALLERGAWPLLRLAPSEFAADFFRFARDFQLDSFAPLDLTEAQSADCFLGIDAPANTRSLAGIDPGLLARATRASLPVREARLQRRWCRTIWPTSALAQQAGMSDEEYATFLAAALLLDRVDPVGAWRDLSEGQQRLVERLSPAREIRIEAAGTDLRLRVDGRTWINSDGRRNMPSGEVFTGPIEDSANGTIKFEIPSSPRGVDVTDVELEFRSGEVVAATAGRGDAYLQQVLRTDARARFLGELGIGTNEGIDRATGSILLDEKIAGTVHLALGRSYPETGGRNASALHWDLICDLRNGGLLTADGEPIVENGRVV
ncbi:MAG: aminopeptidase [Myxococcales bacterium]|nr:aminopeptidase [Myxococcales bacterium]